MIPAYHPQFFEALCEQIPMGMGILHNESASFVFINKMAREQYVVQLPLSLSVFLTEKLHVSPEEASLIETDIANRTTIKKGISPITSKSSWAQLVIEPLDKSFNYSLFYISDLSAAVKSEELLLKEIQKFEALFNNASIGILLCDRFDKLVMINPFANKQFGYENEELIGQSIEKLIPSRYKKTQRAQRQPYDQKQETRNQETSLELYGMRKHGGEFPIQVSLGHFFTEEGAFTLAYVFDDTERKKNEQILRRQKEEMAAVNANMKQLNELLEEKVTQRTHLLEETLSELKHSRDALENALQQEKALNDMKSRFVSMASHEFRTPLSTIFSSVTLLNKYIHSEDPSKVEKHLDRIAGAVNNLNDILNEFLSLGKIEDGKIEPKWAMANLKTLTELAINQMEPLCKLGQIIKHTHEGSEEAVLDERLLTNIFINLISNAIKFSPENSIIEIKTHKKQRSIHIEISDQGMGIAEEEQKHLFERFFRSENVTNIQGTGLGLHIVSRYIQLMSGKILCKSVPQQGTTFTIQFPNQTKIPG